MSVAPEFRPRFKFFTPLSPDDIMEKFQKSRQSSDDIRQKKTHGHIIFSFRDELKHFWSPQLDLSMEKDQESSQTLIRCLIGPAPTVWTLFMFFYGFFGFVGFIGLTLGLSQWTLGKSLWALWLIPVSLAGMLAMYLVSNQGKKLAKDEMITLKNYVDQSLECDCLALAEMHNH